MGKTKKASRITKKAAQKRLDCMVEWYGIRFLFKFGFGSVVALLPMGYLATAGYPIWVVCLGIVVSGFLWYLCWKWAVRFCGKCPYCQTPLVVERKVWGIRETVVSCPNCHLKSDRYQNYEPDYP